MCVIILIVAGIVASTKPVNLQINIGEKAQKYKATILIKIMFMEHNTDTGKMIRFKSKRNVVIIVQT